MCGDPKGKAGARPCPRAPRGRAVTLLVVLAGVALAAAACSSGPPQRAATHHASVPALAERPVTKPQILTTTSSTAATTTTTAPVKVVQPAVHPVPPPTTTTTAAPGPPRCNWANFSTSVTTDQAAYPPGQTVHITLTFRNVGPACSVDESGYACPHVEIDNAQGLVWTSDSVPSTGCAAVLTPGNVTVLPSTWSQSSPFDWTQVDCTTRSQGASGTCAGRQVDTGQYEVVGKDAQGSSQIPPSAPLGVTIS